MIFTALAFRPIQSKFCNVRVSVDLFVIYPFQFNNIFKASALWAHALYKLKCPSVCVPVCLFTFEVPFKRLFFPNYSESQNILDIQFREVGKKRRLNGTSKVNRQTRRQTDISTYRKHWPREPMLWKTSLQNSSHMLNCDLNIKLGKCFFAFLQLGYYTVLYSLDYKVLISVFTSKQKQLEWSHISYVIYPMLNKTE